MVGLNVTARFLFRLTGHFGPFHIAALVSLATVRTGAGFAVVRRRRIGWPHGHAVMMSWSYTGLLAAAVSETATRLPAQRKATSILMQEQSR